MGYNGDEAATREAIYNQAVVEMEAHNADSTQTYTQGVNQFTDLTLEEFQALPIRGLLAGEKSGLPKVGVHEYNGEALAGHSRPLVAPRALGRLQQVRWCLSLNSSWWTAPSRTPDATAVSWTTHSPSTAPPALQASLRTHTPPVMAAARAATLRPSLRVVSLVTRMCPPAPVP